jgi:hypothetical protein
VTGKAKSLRGAHGQLRQLELSQHRVLWNVLLPVLTANAGSLRELHLDYVSPLRLTALNDGATVEGMMAAAPLLQVLTAEFVDCTWENAPQMVRAEPPFAPLHMRHSLEVRFAGADGLIGGMERVGPFAAALADAALQPALSYVSLCGADTAQPAVMGALVDAALARRLPELRLGNCTPMAAAPLARLLAEGALASLEISLFSLLPLFDAAGAALVADALRMNTTLTKLKLDRANLSFDMRATQLLFGALAGHPSVRELRIVRNNFDAGHGSAFGAALAVLIAADAPALHVFDCSVNSLRDAGLAPIVEALALNRHLRELHMCYNYASPKRMSEEFARERLLPAVLANTTLRVLQCVTSYSRTAEFEAQQLVQRRWPHG